MASVTLNLDPVALREATNQAIMGLLTPEARAAIIQEAIASLLKPSTDSWDRGQSPLQRAFTLAVESMAREVALEHVKNDPDMKSRLGELLVEVSARIFKADRDKLADKMAEAFVAGIEQEGRSRR